MEHSRTDHACNILLCDPSVSELTAKYTRCIWHLQGIPVRPVKGESVFIRNPKSDSTSLEGCDAEKSPPPGDAADEAEEPTAEWYHAAFSTMTGKSPDTAFEFGAATE